MFLNAQIRGVDEDALGLGDAVKLNRLISEH
jgi:hypothetical protein